MRHDAYLLLNRLARLPECNSQSLRYVVRVVLDKPPEASGNVILCDVDVISGSH
jgi:hypothetical protein